MKLLLQISIFLMMATQVACSSGGSSSQPATTAATGTMTGGICYNTSGTQVACNESNATNNAPTQAVLPTQITNKAQVPVTSALPASVENPAINQQVQQQSQAVKAEVQKLSEDSESTIIQPSASAALAQPLSGSSIIENNIANSAREMAAIHSISPQQPQAAPVSGVAQISDGSSNEVGLSAGGNAIR